MFDTINSKEINVADFCDFKQNMKYLSESDKLFVAGIIKGILYSKNKDAEKEEGHEAT